MYETKLNIEISNKKVYRSDFTARQYAFGLANPSPLRPHPRAIVKQ